MLLVLEKLLNILAEIDLDSCTHFVIQELRNSSFPDHQVERSYFKQLPHYRALQYENDKLIGYMGLDYRIIGVADTVYKIFGRNRFFCS